MVWRYVTKLQFFFHSYSLFLIGSIPMKAVILVFSIFIPMICCEAILFKLYSIIDLAKRTWSSSVLKVLQIEMFPCLVSIHFCTVLFIYVWWIIMVTDYTVSHLCINNHFLKLICNVICFSSDHCTRVVYGIWLCCTVVL